MLILLRRLHPILVLLVACCLNLAQAASYTIQINVDEAYQPLLSHLDLYKWQDNSDINIDQVQRLFRAAPAQIRSLMATEGFLEVQILATLDEKNGLPLLRYDIDPGPPVLVESLQLTLSGPLSEQADVEQWREKILAQISLKPETRFRQDDWDSSKKQSLALLLADSYPLASLLTSEALLDADNHTARLQLEVDSGPLVTLGPIQVEGLQRVPEQVVKRLTRIEPGVPYRRSSLLDFQSALQGTPYFSSVIVDVEPTLEQPLMTPVLVKIKEAQRQRVGFGVGYNTNTGARVEVNYQHANVADHGWIFNANTSLETRRQFAEAKLATPLTARGYVESVFANNESTQVQNVDSQIYKIGIGRERDVGNIKTLLALTYERESSRVGENVDTSHLQALVLGYNWNRRDLDNPILPTRGNVVSLRIAGAGNKVMSDTSFVHAFGRLSLYTPMPWRSGYLMLRGDVGQVFAEQIELVPSDWLFRIGGVNSVRGYDYQSIGVPQNGAVVGGAVTASSTIEYQHDFAASWRWAIFADAGDATNSWSNFTLHRGYGAGVRWLSPVGSIAADLAFGEPAQQWRMSVSIGLAF
jgi:translocation and assembly module TamA